ncbi:MAG TPA: ABC transporter substrate-binding protein [Syntrophomonadaceae bacterium]|nr:ABC transporter substrate-binding protein [Syntrophomonadaceae bacterium]
MIKVQIQLPININRRFEEMLGEHFEANQKNYKDKIEIKNAHGSGSEREADIKNADILIGFIPELAMQTDEEMRGQMMSTVNRFPISKTLEDMGFVDPQGYFHTFGIVPFVIFYNPEYTAAAELPRTWNELLDSKWKGRILMPGKEHIAPKVIRAILKHQNPSKAHIVDENITYKGMPPNVIQAVKNGEFALGIANITFGKISETQNIKMIWPNDGLLCMPQMIAWKKGSEENLLKLGDFLLSPKVQTFLSQQAFIPVAPGNEPSEIIKRDDISLKWAGWNDFREAMRNSES